jgi:hypothetical protein
MTSHMRAGFVLASFAMVSLPVHGQTTPRTAGRRIHVDEVVPASAPRTLAARLAQVDAAIRCRVERSSTRAIQNSVPVGVNPALGAEPVTEHTVTLLEILKVGPKLPVTSSEMTIFQPVGAALIDGVNVVKEHGTFRAFAVGEEYVLFLKWDSVLGEFEVNNGADAFLLRDGAVATSGDWPHSRGEQGIPVPQFLAHVREAAKAAASR